MNNNTGKDHIAVRGACNHSPIEEPQMRVTKATLDDLVEASNNLSHGDLADFEAMQSGRNIMAVLTGALDETTQAIRSNGQVLAIGGHANGGIWFVTTNIVNGLPVSERFRFYRILKTYLASIKRESPLETPFTNLVSVGNKAHLRLLEALGATFHTDCVISPAGFPFKQFWL
ncbi:MULTISPECIES: phage protein Gp13 family protein [unclassified Pseudomonas]|uniref:phage protein Gp13 family protein n=1 Tax=unclassified Pseudomonas TaxID=196821 RepID=UPI0025EF0B6A|nr:MULTISPECIES: phage protein Gp13 family protein [unclassified Pseudomonas]